MDILPQEILLLLYRGRNLSKMTYVPRPAINCPLSGKPAQVCSIPRNTINAGYAILLLSMEIIILLIDHCI